MYVTVAKRSGKIRHGRGWTGSRPSDWQDGFACPTPNSKKGQSRSSSLAPTSSSQGAPCRSVPGLWGHCLHRLLNKKSLRNIFYRTRAWWHAFTSECSKHQVVMNTKLPRVSWNRFPSRVVLSMALEAFKDLTGSSPQQPGLISHPSHLTSGILFCLTFSLKPTCCWSFTIQASKPSTLARILGPIHYKGTARYPPPARKVSRPRFS